jgi:Spy/CpxP family protein refolding chaperone
MGRMKQLWLISFLFIGMGTVVAQPSEKEMERLHSLKIAFLTDKLDLKPDQAQKFWPVHNEYEKQLRDFQEKRRDILMGIRKGELTDDQIEENIKQSFDIEEKTVKLKREYHNKFSSILDVHQLAELYVAEQEFQRRVIKELHKRKMKRFDSEREHHQREGK